MKKTMVIWKKIWYFGDNYNTMEKLWYYTKNYGTPIDEKNTVNYLKV